MSSSAALSLPPTIQRLYELVKDGKRVPIVKMHEAVFGLPAGPLSQRDMQQRVGSYVTKLNRRIRKQKKILKPAEIKGTYALVKLDN